MALCVCVNVNVRSGSILVILKFPGLVPVTIFKLIVAQYQQYSLIDKWPLTPIVLGRR